MIVCSFLFSIFALAVGRYLAEDCDGKRLIYLSKAVFRTRKQSFNSVIDPSRIWEVEEASDTKRSTL